MSIFEVRGGSLYRKDAATAAQISFDNSGTDLISTNAQSAITEINNSLANKQPKTLATPITVAGTQQTTVEGALGAINTEDAKAYKSDDATETAIADADYIPFYDTSASAMKKIAVSNLDLGGGVEETAVSQYVETIGATAQGTYKVGDYFLAADGYYYRCKSAITGDSTTITTNNAEQTTISKAIAQSANYSTTEHVIGTWIDGSTLYEKSVEFGALPNADLKTVAHGINNIKIFVSVDAVSGTSQAGIPLPLAYNNAIDPIYVSVDTTNVNIRTWSNWSTYTNTFITIKYTKTV